MIPLSLSASSLANAETCLARWKAENFDRVPAMQNRAADTGTAVHGALEMFVKMVFLEKRAEWSNLALLLDLYKLSYVDTFQSAELETSEFEDGLELVKVWYNRTTWDDVTVMSVEVKENFPIKTSIGEIPFNYIWDRADMLGPHEYRVVDYKTIRAFISPEQLKKKIQPRAYALAAQIKWPHAERIWVEYDLLRHSSVGAVFTKDDNALMWRYLKRAAERIIAADEHNTPETLNPECKFCVRKIACDTLNRAIRGGSVFSLTPDQAAKRKLQITSQIKALEYIEAELDTVLLKEAEQNDVFEWVTDDVKVEITASRRRQINSNAVANIVGSDLAKKYGNFTLGNVDKMLKDDTLSLEQRAEIKKLIGYKYGEPTAKVTPVSPLEEE